MAKKTKSSVPAKSTRSKGAIIPWDGKVITEPGIYSGVPLDLYHSAELFGQVPSISSSGLRTIIDRSPAHYWATSPYNPERVEQEDKKHFVLGRAVHHLVLGEKYFGELFTIRPDEIYDPKKGEVVPWHANRTPCIKWMAQQAELGKTVLSQDDVTNIKGMWTRLSKNPLVQQGLLNGHVENSYFWRDKETGIWLKWRPDTTPIASLDFVDIKTTTDVRYHKLMSTIADYAYYQQGALGSVACRELIGKEMQSFSLLFIEKVSPWCEALTTIKTPLLQYGERANRAALRIFWKCLKENSWPGPAENDVSYIEISSRALEVLTERLTRLEGEVDV